MGNQEVTDCLSGPWTHWVNHGDHTRKIRVLELPDSTLECAGRLAGGNGTIALECELFTPGGQQSRVTRVRKAGS